MSLLGKPEKSYGEKIKDCGFLGKPEKSLFLSHFRQEEMKDCDFFGCKTGKNRCGNVIGPKPPKD